MELLAMARIRNDMSNFTTVAALTQGIHPHTDIDIQAQYGVHSTTNVNSTTIIIRII